MNIGWKGWFLRNGFGQMEVQSEVSSWTEVRDISVGNYCERKWNGESIARYSAGQAKSMPDRVLVNLISLLDLL